MGGAIILQGKVAEMATGEGKTLTATLPACAAALAGTPVHVVSVNDYLSGRDAAWMRPVYEALGLTVGSIVHGRNREERKAAYACDITYVTNKEVVFDYLRDRLLLGPGSRRAQLAAERLYAETPRIDNLVMRGLHFAIVDEADSVFIDEARTPVILSAPPGESQEERLYQEALVVADSLEEGEHYEVDHREREIHLTEAGAGLLESVTAEMDPFWAGPRRRESLVVDTLSAEHLFERDKHYLVRDDKVVIIDEYTGRVMPDRTWSLGLHQAVEAKEGVRITAPPEILAQISYQHFFRRYLRLAGMTGTAWEVAGELWDVYGLATVRIPTHKPARITFESSRMLPTAEEKWDAVAHRVQVLRDQGRPVLIGTRSVASSERLSEVMREAGIEHRVLNARQDEEEAEIIGGAGEEGRVTLATNMAGRGTDIKLGEGVARLGGLHVIATERHEAGRIDRQLYGRCARQGDRGSCEEILSAEDELLQHYGPAPLRFLVRLASRRGEVRPRWVGRMLARSAQWLAERRHRAIRRQVLRMDERLRSALGFAGTGD
jgi:preprotein translocase subunit SecA